MKAEDVDWENVSSRQRISPHPNVYSMQSLTQDYKKIVGTSYKQILLLFKFPVGYLFWSTKDGKRIQNHIFKKLFKQPHFFHKQALKVKKIGDTYISWAKQLAREDISKFTQAEIVQAYNEFIGHYKQLYANYFMINDFEPGLIRILRLYLKTKTPNEETAARYFTILTTEPRAQIINTEKLAALKLAKKIENSKKWKAYFKDKKTEQLIRKDTKLNNLFKKHTSNFFWITRDYDDDVLTYSDFIERMAHLLKNNPLAQLEKLQAVIKNHESDIKKIIKEANIDHDHANWFSEMREGIYIKELRKTYTSLSLHYFDVILKEICKRCKITMKEARHLMVDDIPQVFKDANFKKELKQRIKCSAFNTSKGKTEIILGKRAEKLFNKVVLIKKNVDEFKGVPVSAGVVKGPVRLVLDLDEMDKVKKGDIVVTSQLGPNYAPVFVKAIGLVCNGGTGITSHSATLAREAKIPAIVATKIATLVLKDGDFIEVDGISGTVKILKRYQKK